MNVIKKHDKWECRQKWPNIAIHDEDQGEATEIESDDLVNVFQNNIILSFEYIEGISGDKKINNNRLIKRLTIIRGVIEIAEHNLGVEITDLRKQILSKTGQWK